MTDRRRAKRGTRTVGRGAPRCSSNPKIPFNMDVFGIFVNTAIRYWIIEHERNFEQFNLFQFAVVKGTLKRPHNYTHCFLHLEKFLDTRNILGAAQGRDNEPLCHPLCHPDSRHPSPDLLVVTTRGSLSLGQSVTVALTKNQSRFIFPQLFGYFLTRLS